MKANAIRLLILMGLVVAGCALLRGPTPEVGPGKPAPGVEGPDGSGQLFSLSDYPDRVVALSFWGGF